MGERQLSDYPGISASLWIDKLLSSEAKMYVLPLGKQKKVGRSLILLVFNITILNLTGRMTDFFQNNEV